MDENYNFLIQKLKKQYLEEDVNRIINGYKQNRKVTFRINTLKANNEEVLEEFKNNNIEIETVEYIENAYIVNTQEKVIQSMECYKQGKIYLQSLSSMLPPIYLEPKENENILDMAAAPGSKTTQIAAITNNRAYITACEINKARVERLKYNLEKQGVTSVVVMNIDARNLDDMFSFDKILLDAPCSGSGTFLLNEEKTNQKFNESLLEKIAKTQTALIKKAIKILKPGQEMIYSTCSIFEEENEEILNKILKKGEVEIVPINLKKEIPTLPSKISGTICVCPNELFEGFFVAKLRIK